MQYHRSYVIIACDPQKAWLRLRNLTLRCLAAAIMMSTPHVTTNGTTDGSRTTDNDSSPEVLRDLMAQLNQLVDEIQDEYSPVRQVRGSVKHLCFTYPFPDIAALMDLLYISRSSAVRPTLRSSTSFSQDLFGLFFFFCIKIPLFTLTY